MKQKIRKILNFFLSAFILLNSVTSLTTVYAQENDVDYSEAKEEIIELGNLEDIMVDLLGFDPNAPMLLDTSEKLSGPLAYIHVPGSVYGYDYITKLGVDGKVVFCIEPMQLFVAGTDYPVDTKKWDELSEAQRQAIWEINYYGYSYPGHETDRYYIATQLMIWDVVDKWYDPYHMDGTTPMDVSAELNEITRLRSQPQGRPSFNNTTIKTGLNTPVTITDTKGTLGNYSVNGGKGVNTTVSGNNLTVEITSESYEKTITFSRKYSARDVNIIYGSAANQRVIYLAKRSDPTPNFKLNFELLYADINVDKRDIETGAVAQGDAKLSGAEFTIYNSKNEAVETLVTDNKGEATSKKYPIGTSYTIRETQAPEGYLLTESENKVELKFDGNNTKEHFDTTVENQVIKGKIEIAKSIESEKKYPFESIIETPGVNFTFDIILKSSNETVATLVTDNEGRAISDYLPYGTYIVKEREVEGYDTLAPFEVKIEKDQKTYFYNIFNDGLKAEINIYKVDAETKKRIPAADVEFKIKDDKGNYVTQTVMYPSKYKTDTFVTDNEGSVHLPEPLHFGNYFICEIKAPYGYVLQGSEIPLNVDGKSTEIFMNFENKQQYGQLYVEKFGEFFSGAETEATEYGDLYTPVYEEKNLAGVTYEITAREDIVGQEGTVYFSKGEVVETFTTTEEITVSEPLHLGAYSIRETATIDGYVLDENTYDFDVEYAGQLIEIVQIGKEFKNERQKLNLTIAKTFEEDDKDAYKDVVFGVYTSNNLTVNEATVIPADSLVGLLTIDENGNNVEQLDLPYGEYYAKELKTNIAYELNENKYPFVFESDISGSATVDINVGPIENNKRRLDIEINKVDADHKDHYLDGAIFEVYDKTSNEYVTTICSGKLMIKDTAKGVEYEIATDENFENIIKTVKTDSDKEIILALDEGTYYARKALTTSEDDVDPEFTINDNPITRHVVNHGKATYTDAIYGHEYEFKEIVAPTSYHLNSKPLTVEVIADRDTTIIRKTFVNHRIEIPNTGV